MLRFANKMPLLATLFALTLQLHTPLEAAEVTRLSVSIPGPGAASYYPIELISKIGADKAEGAELRVVFSPGGPDALNQMLNNNTDFAVVGLPAAMSVRLKDNRLTAIAAVNDLPLYALLVRYALKGEVKSIADLKGRAIGLHSNSASSKSTSQQVLELLFRRGGVAPGTYRIIGIGRRWESEALMLKTGAVDAVIGDEPHATHMASEKIAFPLIHLGDTETIRLFAGAGFLRGALIARSDKLERDPGKAALMVRILKRTLAWISTHSAEDFANAMEIVDSDERQKLITVLNKYPRQYSKDGSFSSRQLRDTEIFFIDSQAGNVQAQNFRIEAMINDQWVGRRD